MGVEVLISTTTASSSDNSGIIQNLIDVLTGKVATIALDQLSSLLGLNNPVPSPLSDPVGFLTHPLISPIILAAVTLNPPALALAMGGLAGNLVLTHIFTIATKHLSAPLWQQLDKRSLFVNILPPPTTTRRKTSKNWLRS